MANEEKTVILEIEENLLTCDKNILITNSDYFSAMLAGNFKESFQRIIKIQDVDLATFEAILALLRDDAYLSEDQDIYSILKCASMLQFISIKEKCVSLLQMILNQATCLCIWKYAEMLSISPLWIQAKFMALEEFYSIIEDTHIFELNLDHICSYLGHMYLNVKDEFLVFQTAMNWWYENQAHYDQEDYFEVLLRLLNCVDFRQLTEFEVKEMLSYPNIVDDTEVTSVLNGVMEFKRNKIVDESTIPEKHLSYARHLCNSRSRRKAKIPGLLLRQLSALGSNCSKQMVYKHVVYNEYSNSFKEFLPIDGTKIGDDLTGFHLLSYREYICLFGGEFILGCGQWNRNFWVYDTIKEKWERKTVLPVSRRHFECALVNDCIYIVGGVGNFRIVQENIILYDFKADKWSSVICLPVSDRKLKCCDFKGQLFLISFHGNGSKTEAYFFEKANLSWSSICIEIDKDDVFEMGDFTVFSSQDYLYIKGKLLLTFQLLEKKLVLLKRTKLNCIDYEEIKSVLCNDSIYTMYKYKDEQYNLGISLEKFDLSTGKSSYIFENKGKDMGLLEFDGKMFYPTTITKLFATHDYLIIKNENPINNPIIK